MSRAESLQVKTERPEHWVPRPYTRQGCENVRNRARAAHARHAHAVASNLDDRKHERQGVGGERRVPRLNLVGHLVLGPFREARAHHGKNLALGVERKLQLAAGERTKRTCRLVELGNVFALHVVEVLQERAQLEALVVDVARVVEHVCSHASQENSFGGNCGDDLGCDDAGAKDAFAR
eukprot:4539918-Prymnesium_polylepis.1